MICKDCKVYVRASHAKCAERNKGKPTPDCDCQHRVVEPKVVNTVVRPVLRPPVRRS